MAAKVYLVNYKSQADYSVYFVDYSSQEKKIIKSSQEVN